MNIVRVKLDQIEVGKDRLRPINEAYAIEIAESFKVLGQIVPIELVEIKKGSEKYRPTHGAHRIRAAQINEDEDILAVIWEGDKRQEKARQVAENVIRQPLTVLAKAASVAEWQKLYPKAQWGGDRRLGQVAETATCPARFTVHAADQMGISETAVRDLLKIHAGITTPVRNLVAGTALEDHREFLLELATVEDSDEQLRIARVMLDEGKTFKQVTTDVPEPDKAPDQKAFDGFVKRFRKTDDKGRRRIIQWLVDEGHIRAEQVAFS